MLELFKAVDSLYNSCQSCQQLDGCQNCQKLAAGRYFCYSDIRKYGIFNVFYLNRFAVSLLAIVRNCRVSVLGSLF